MISSWWPSVFKRLSTEFCYRFDGILPYAAPNSLLILFDKLTMKLAINSLEKILIRSMQIYETRLAIIRQIIFDEP